MTSPTTPESPRTTTVPGTDLDGRTLIGDSGGLSLVYEVGASSALPGLLVVETEHGPLYLDPDESYRVLAD